MTLGTSLNLINQYQANTTAAQAVMNQVSTSLQSIESQITNAQAQAEAAQNSSNTASSETGAVAALGGMITDLVSIGNTTFNGMQVFGGTKTTSPAFASDGTYQGDSGQLTRDIGPDDAVNISFTGQQVFQGGGVDLIQTLKSLQTAIQNNDSSGISTQFNNLGTSLNNILGLQATMGSEIQRVSTSQTSLQNSNQFLTTLQSSNDDVDVAQAAIQLQNYQNAYQQAIEAGSQILSNSLTHFLSLSSL